jgi:flavodoxin
MNGVIVCDSYYGNSLQVAEALGEEFRVLGHDVTVVNLHKQRLDPRKPPVAGADFLAVGGPTRIKNMSRRARSFANKLDPAKLGDIRILCFDTWGPLDKDPAKNGEDNQWLFPGGGAKTRDELAGAGFAVYPSVLRCLVTGMKGPLAEDALDSARRFARQFAADELS